MVVSQQQTLHFFVSAIVCYTRGVKEDRRAYNPPSSIKEPLTSLENVAFARNLLRPGRCRPAFMCKPSETAATVAADPTETTDDTNHPVPWLRRYTRWRQTSKEESVQAENRILSLSGVELHAAEVPTGPKPNQFMNTVIGGPPSAPALVVIPGYGAGIGFFFRNLATLCENFRVHAVDLLGTGLSGRPTWKARNREETEEFFLDSLCTWRSAMGIDKMVLVGHSMGGLISARYALKYPEHVEHLILVCPAGITKKQDDWEMPELFRNPWSVPGAIFRVFNQFLEWGVTPGGVVRSMGPWGNNMVKGYIQRRFKNSMGLTDEETSAFEEYLYHIMSAPGSGEHALRYLLGPFAWGRAPLEEDLRNIKVPMTFIYGDKDWTGTDGAQRAMNGLATMRPALSDADQKLITLPKAGHYAFLDQPKLFKEHMLSICSPYFKNTEEALKVSDAEGARQPGFPAAARNVRHIVPRISPETGQSLPSDGSAGTHDTPSFQRHSGVDDIEPSDPTPATDEHRQGSGAVGHVSILSSDSIAAEVRKQVEL